MTPGSVLLFVHPPFYAVGDKVFFDTQAQNGLRLWAKNFDEVRIMAPLEHTPGGAPADASPLQPFLEKHPTVTPVMLPRRGTIRFLTQDIWREKKTIREQIDRSEFLVFGFSGYIGDWGTVACRMAKRMGRPYAVFKDGVAHRVLRIAQEKENRSPLTQLRHLLENRWMRRSDRQVVKSSTLALLHGQDTMEYYQSYATQPRMVHDIHISKADLIPRDVLDLRLRGRKADALRISYAGRVEQIKGPDHWVNAIGAAQASNVEISAQWFGTGALLDEHRELVTSKALNKVIDFKGFVDHRDMLQELRKSDVFVFAHMTEESPRCLIEALAAGLPLVGYDCAFARDLVGETGAGLFVPRGDIDALADALRTLARSPEKVEAMSQGARRAAAPLNDDDVFRERGKIIKSALGSRS